MREMLQCSGYRSRLADRVLLPLWLCLRSYDATCESRVLGRSSFVERASYKMRSCYLPLRVGYPIARDFACLAYARETAFFASTPFLALLLQLPRCNPLHASQPLPYPFLLTYLSSKSAASDQSQDVGVYIAAAHPVEPGGGYVDEATEGQGAAGVQGADGGVCGMFAHAHHLDALELQRSEKGPRRVSPRIVSLLPPPAHAVSTEKRRERADRTWCGCAGGSTSEEAMEREKQIFLAQARSTSDESKTV